MILMVKNAFSFSVLKAGSLERSHHTTVQHKKEHQKVKPTQNNLKCTKKAPPNSKNIK